MTIYFASDHAGFSLRQTLLAHVQAVKEKMINKMPPGALYYGRKVLECEKHWCSRHPGSMETVF